MWILPARRYARAALAMFFVQYVSVCPSVTSRYCIETTERIGIVLAQRRHSTYYTRLTTLCCKRIRVSQKLRVLPSGTLYQILDLEMSPRHIDRRKCCQLSSTDNRRQFITPSVHRCVQHCGRDAARRAAGTSLRYASRQTDRHAHRSTWHLVRGKQSNKPIFTARRYASASYAMALTLMLRNTRSDYPVSTIH